MSELEQGLHLTPSFGHTVQALLSEVAMLSEGREIEQVADFITLISPSMVRSKPRLMPVQRQWWLLLYRLFFQSKKTLDAQILYDRLHVVPRYRPLFLTFNQLTWLLDKDADCMKRFFSNFATIVHLDLEGRYAEAYNVVVHDTVGITLPNKHQNSLCALRVQREQLLALRKSVHPTMFLI